MEPDKGRRSIKIIYPPRKSQELYLNPPRDGSDNPGMPETIECPNCLRLLARIAKLEARIAKLEADLRRGISALCIGGGMGIAMLFER